MVYSMKEAMMRLRVCRNTLTKMIKNGQIKAIRIGSHWCFTPEELERVCTEGTDR